MASLSREMRKDLERVVKEARRVAERGARKAFEELAVHDREPASGLSPDQRGLRNRLRAHGRQLGDRRDEKRGTQEIERLVSECAYEHWHRLLFARFLAECNLLIEPASGVAISLGECRELALEQGTDWLLLASGFAERMLPQIFRAGDPALEVALPPETRQKLEELLKSLPSEVFTADDSLGWVYQFWQAERKDQVNDSGVKIGADELPAVTQLFTEDYMVLFLLHNTLGAWWSAKRRAEGKDSTLPGYEWTYLRLHDDGTPAAGTFGGWPRAAKDLRLLDPCMGSGHFLVFALPILVGFRAEEEGLSLETAVEAVLRDNLFGLELDQRCTQIAAFNLALAAWRLVGYRQLPPLNLACSGLGINSKEEDWLGLTGDNATLRGWMSRLYGLFKQAPVLGSLIDPRRALGHLFATEFATARPLLEQALEAEHPGETSDELVVAAKGLLAAARLLGDTFSLLITNVPYLARGKQAPPLADYCETEHPDAKIDLATCFLERCLRLCGGGGSVGLVTPQNWLFLNSYRTLRGRLLRECRWNLVARLGPGAFETISGEVVNVALVGMTNDRPADGQHFVGIDAADQDSPSDKERELRTGVLAHVAQAQQLQNPDAAVVIRPGAVGRPLREFAECWQGLVTGDDNRFVINLWEIPAKTKRWEWFQRPPQATEFFDGRDALLRWDGGRGDLHLNSGAHNFPSRHMLGRPGVAIQRMGPLNAALLSGEIFGDHVAPLVPKDPGLLTALWCFCTSEEFRASVRGYDATLKVAVGALLKVPFDVGRWQSAAVAAYPNGLPKPDTQDPREWLFKGNPRDSKYPLHVAVARLVGYRWPTQTGSTFPGCSSLGPDGLERHADHDGIVCLPSLKGEPPAVDRLRDLLADAYGAEWSPTKQASLLAHAGHPGDALEGWLSEAFFEEHCGLFRQRPFVWHVWDGLRSGFSALVNYHHLAAPNGDGRRTLEKLIYSYLGDWIERQRDDQRAGIEGADARVAAAIHLKSELERILEGEPPYDLFARWKPLHEEPIGWEPDLDDGVRVNIRPFLTARPLSAKGKSACILRVRPKIKWEKDRGTEPERPRQHFPWFWGWDEETEDFAGGREFDGNRWNDLHLTRAFKQAARERHALRQEAQAR